MHADMSTIDVASELKLTQFRKQSLRKTFEQIELQSSSILFLALQWNDMESHFDSVQNAIIQRQEQLVSVEESLRKQLEEVKSREERVESLQETVNCKLQEVELNEAKEKLVFDERMKEFDSMRVTLEERSREIEMSQAVVEEGVKALNLKEEWFRVLEESSDKRTKELQDLQKSVKESLEEFAIQETHLKFVEQWSEERIKDVELREARIRESLNAIELEKKELKLKEKNLHYLEKALASKEKKLEEQYVEIESKVRSLLEWENTFALKEKRLGEQYVELEMLERTVKERVEEVEVNDRLMKERIEEFELKDRQLKELAEEVELKEREAKQRADEADLLDRKVKERAKELELKDQEVKQRAEELELKDQGVNQRVDEVDLIERTVKERVEEVEVNDRLVKERIEEFELKDRQLKELAEEVELKEREVKQRADEADLLERKVKERAKELELKDQEVKQRAEELELKDQGVKQRVDEVDLIERKVKERAEELELKDREVKERAERVDLKDKKVKELAEKVDLKDREVKERAERVDSKIRKVKERDQELELKNRKLKKRSEEVELKDRKVKERAEEVDFKGWKLKKLAEEIALKDREVKRRAEEVDSIGEEVDLLDQKVKERAEELELKNQEVKERAKLVDLEDQKMKERTEELNLKEIMYEESQKKFSLKEDNLMESYLDIQLKEDMVKKHAEKVLLKENTLAQCTVQLESTEYELAERSKKIEVKEYELLERTKEVDSKEVMLDQRINEIELKEKQIEQHSVVSETKDKGSTEIVIYDINSKVFEKSTGNIVLDKLTSKQARLPEIMNGQSLQTYLNKHCNEHETMHDDVAAILSESSDPGKLVLDVIQEFYPLSTTENGNPSIRLCVVQKSCILLLEGLLWLSPEISSDTKHAAAKLAFDWTTKMRKELQNDMEVLGFLLLLAIYDLASDFDNTELMTYLLAVTRHGSQLCCLVASQLCRLLGLVDKLSDFVVNLIKELKFLYAFELICSFKLAKKFPPVPLLKAYLRNWTQASMTKQNVLDKRIADINRVIKCIRNQNKYCGHSSKKLKNFVSELTQSKADISRKKRAFIATKVHRRSRSRTSRLVSNIRQQQQCRPGTGISVSDLNTCSSADSVSPSMQFPYHQRSHTGEVSGISSTPIRTKQKKVQNLQTNDNKARCKTTFEQLMMVPANMRHHSKEAAIKLALQLKANINGETTTKMGAFRFLQLVANYDLASSFAADELICYLKKVQRRRQTLDLFWPLGLLNEVPGFVENLIKEDCCLDAIRYICQFELKHKFPLVPILRTYLNRMTEKTRLLAHRFPEDQNFSINRELSATRTVLNHIKNHKLELEYPPKILEDRVTELEDYKARNVTSNKNVQHENENNISTSTTDTPSLHPLLQRQKAQPQHQSGINCFGTTESTDCPPSDVTTAHSNQIPRAQAHTQPQPLHQSGIKRPRTESTECPPNDVTAHSNRRPPKRNSRLVDGHWSQNSSGHHFVGGYPPMSQYNGSHSNIDNSCYAAVHPGHLDRQVAYCGSSQTYQPPGNIDHLMSYDCNGNGYGHPECHKAPPPSDVYGQPPQFYPSFYHYVRPAGK